ncbi:MAG: hypothetical protein JNJ54_34960 [Myxococcaceae bacterium]|nr:hypothetical protein [Myxococcaceae bacterium]
MAAAKPKPVAVTREGVPVYVDARTSSGAVVVRVGLVQRELTPDQARVLARQLRRAAAVLDPDPTE